MDGALKELFATLGASGPVGILAGLAILAVIFLYRDNKSIQEKRIEENERNLTTLEANTVALNHLSDIIRTTLIGRQ